MNLTGAFTAVSLTELRYLVAVDAEQHFGRAAARCHVTQPTLSAGIRKLEGTLGVTLFERTQRSVRTTAVGRELVAEARQILDATERLYERAAASDGPLTGPWHLGFIPTLGPYLLPWLLPLLHAAFPRLRPCPIEATTDELIGALREHRVDAAFLALPVVEDGLEEIPLFDEPFDLLVSSEHRLARRARLRAEELAGERVLLLTEGHCLRDQALDVCERHAAVTDPGDPDVRATSLETLRQLVAAGLGSTLLPALAVRPDHDDVTRRIPFQQPAPHRRIGLVHRRSFPRRGDLEQLAEVVRAGLPEQVQVVRDGARASGTFGA